MGKFVDLTGQKFGKLTVLYRAKDHVSPSGYRFSRWKVKCEKCKTEYDLDKKLFLNKKNQTCSQHTHTYKNIVGQKFGKLIVIGKGKDYIYSNGTKKEVRWKVKCEKCEIEYDLDKTSFLKTKNQTCNQHSHAYIDLLGRRFGKLMVIKKDEEYYIYPKSKKKSIRWICKCDCGDSVSVIGDSLKAKKETQCKECQYKSMQLNGYMSYQRLHSIKQGAKKRNIYFDPKINRKYLWDLFLKQNRKCALSNLPIHFAESTKQEKSHKGTTASLDRIDSSKEYIKSNIQWLHKDINKMKFTCSNSEFIKICKDITRWNKL